MATEALKSTAITNLDSSPVSANDTGEGADGFLRLVGDYVTTTSGVTAGSTYQIVRIPTNAKVKEVITEGEAMTAGAFDVGLYYSSSTSDGTQASVQGTAVDADFFATAVSFASAVTPTNITNESGTYTLNKRNQPIWQAAGLSSDPGGFFDLVFTSTATVTAGARMGASVRYVL